MKIDSIQSGIVLDHIKAGKSMQIYKYLGLDDLDCSVAIIKNASSLNSFNKVLIANHIRTCVKENIQAGNDEVVEELVSTLQKLMK